MKRVIDIYQQSDMGNGFGHIAECEGSSLRDSLNWIERNIQSWGTLTIHRGEKIIRCFDFDLYSPQQRVFYHHLSGWQYNLKVQEITFSYCFMCADIDICLKE